VRFVSTKQSSPPFLSSTLSTLSDSWTFDPTLSGEGEKVKDPPTHMRVLYTSGGGEGSGNEVDPSGDSRGSATIGGNKMTVRKRRVGVSERRESRVGDEIYVRESPGCKVAPSVMSSVASLLYRVGSVDASSLARSRVTRSCDTIGAVESSLSLQARKATDEVGEREDGELAPDEAARRCIDLQRL
jgi:hypothetical protein